MRDERIREIALDAAACTCVQQVEYVLRQALSERDAEIIAWASNPSIGSEEGYVQLGDLLAFLKEARDAG